MQAVAIVAHGPLRRVLLGIRALNAGNLRIDAFETRFQHCLRANSVKVVSKLWQAVGVGAHSPLRRMLLRVGTLNAGHLNINDFEWS